MRLKMRSCLVLCCVALALSVALADIKPPTVYVYTRNPVKYGELNDLICHTDGFHPPRIEITLKQDGAKFPGCVESDLSFKHNWAYYKTVTVPFLPLENVQYECEVKHNEGTPKVYQLESLM